MIVSAGALYSVRKFSFLQNLYSIYR